MCISIVHLRCHGLPGSRDGRALYVLWWLSNAFNQFEHSIITNFTSATIELNNNIKTKMQTNKKFDEWHNEWRVKIDGKYERTQIQHNAAE